MTGAGDMDMSVLFLSIVVWSLALYSLRVALAGDPLCVSVYRADEGLLKRVGRVVMEGMEPAAEDEIQFLRRFTRLGVLELVVSLVELVMLLYVVMQIKTPWLVWLAWGLLFKNFALLLLNWLYLRRKRLPDTSIFEQLLALPRWYLWLDRAAAFASGAGFILIILALNGYLGGDAK